MESEKLTLDDVPEIVVAHVLALEEISESAPGNGPLMVIRVLAALQLDLVDDLTGPDARRIGVIVGRMVLQVKAEIAALGN